MHFRSGVKGLLLGAWCFLLLCSCTPIRNGSAIQQRASIPSRIPVIDITDLYHPSQDKGDNFDLIAAYGLPEVDLKAVILDCTEEFRKPVTSAAPGLGVDKAGPREPGFIPVLQMNYIFNRSVPCASGPFCPMRSQEDQMLDAPGFQQQGVRLLLDTLRKSPNPVQIVSFGSARPLAVAYNREPELVRRKVARIHLSAGATAPGFLEWNVALDTNAFLRLITSDLPIALYPCAANNSRREKGVEYLPVFSYDEHNTYWNLPNLQFIYSLDPQLRRYLRYAITRSARVDFLRAMYVDPTLPMEPSLLNAEHAVWETAVWINVADRKLVRHADGRCRIIPACEVEASDEILPNELRPCRLNVLPNGMFSFKETTEPTNIHIYYRGDPLKNQQALREALPELYRSFKPGLQESRSEAPSPVAKGDR